MLNMFLLFGVKIFTSNTKTLFLAKSRGSHWIRLVLIGVFVGYACEEESRKVTPDSQRKEQTLVLNVKHY